MKKRTVRIAVVVSRYRPEITEALLRHCLATLSAQGVPAARTKVVYVPGSLEIPLAAKRLARKKLYDAIIVFGAVFKGKTYHFEQVSNECIRGCMDVTYEYEVPVIFEVLSVYNAKDALERATGTIDNRGVEGARSALAMIDTLESI